MVSLTECILEKLNSGERMSILVPQKESDKAKKILEREFDVRCIKDINNDTVTEIILKQKRTNKILNRVKELLKNLEWADYPKNTRTPHI